MKAVIVSGGTPPSYELLKEELACESVIICADSGGDCLYKHGLLPDYLLGDFDSIDGEAFEYFKREGVSIEGYKRDKDYTDTQISIRKAMELGCTEIVLLGCSGNRLDHTLGNIGLLKECLNNGIKASLRDDINAVTLVDSSTTIEGVKGQVFSLQAYCECVKELTIIGAKFGLDKYNLYLGDPLTISNEFSEEKVSLQFKSGMLLIMRSKI